MIKNPRTTVLGIVTIMSTCLMAAGSWAKGIPVDWTSFAIGVSSGLGLLHAADARAANGNGNHKPPPSEPPKN